MQKSDNHYEADMAMIRIILNNVYIIGCHLALRLTHTKKIMNLICCYSIVVVCSLKGLKANLKASNMSL